MFVPVSITLGAGGSRQAVYDRIVDMAAKFEQLGERAADMSEPLTAVGEDLHAQIAATLATQGASGASGPWRALSPAYGAWKSKHRPGVPMLVGLRPARKGSRKHPTRPQTYVVSGRMVRTLLQPLGDKLTWRVTPKMLTYTPTSDIAGWHETGTPKMPARPPVDVSVTFLHSVDRQFVAWFNRLMTQAGFAP